ncbi:transglutaminase-like domain-containing protein [Thiobacillus sp.]|jgi:transglutaminase-like putative cysteine protease|uniref:transglutaminase-like domain-containing protein n=1 Tax=Thiobacillus sp. TaxID=924 RepID=UPI0025F5DEBB|nr:transglutaminase-like domain-containing protein [Thiobacillus sp.]
MQRRDFLMTSAAMAAGVVWPASQAMAAFDPSPDAGWRTFEVTHRVEVLKPHGATRVWLPLPSMQEQDWIRPMGNLWQGDADRAQLLRDRKRGVDMLYGEWAPEKKPVLEVTSRFATRDRAIDLARAGQMAPLSASMHRRYTRATKLLPTDGIVRKTARDITRRAKTDQDKARAIYEWVVDNTARNPKTRGCGLGDIRFMLETGDLTGKCADLNSLYVGLARAAGLPARDIYGIRVADSRFGYKSLGKSGDISKAQHCRAEVWLSGHGWVPVDPADVRKVMLEEPPGGRSLTDDMVVDARRRLFGAWEMNWLAYNTAHDLPLPGSRDVTLPFLMYPQAETADGMLDSLDASSFSYRITSKEITAPS